MIIMQENKHLRFLICFIVLAILSGTNAGFFDNFKDGIKKAEGLANALGTSGEGEVSRGNGCKITWSFKGQVIGIKWKYIGVCVDTCTGISKTSVKNSKGGAIEHCLNDIFNELGSRGEL